MAWHGIRERRQECREDRPEQRDDRRGGGTVHYRMRQQLVSIGDDYWIEDDEGRRVFKVDGKALRIRQTLTSRTRRETCSSRFRNRPVTPLRDGWPG
jgi:hypothetical protein